MGESYYDKHGREFAKQTAHLDASFLYERFLQHLPKGGTILDAGCGSGRDTKKFLEMGYEVTAMDSSPSMVALAKELTGRDVMLMSFQEMSFVEQFDGIWACASLLHVGKQAIDDVLARLTRALKSNGVLYMSFKYGSGESERQGRLFNNYTEETLAEVLSKYHQLAVIDIWTSNDVRKERETEIWLNALVRKDG